MLGEEIRYNGEHKKHSYVVEELSQEFNFLSFCPEVSMGLGVPRAPIKLLSEDGHILLVDAKDASIDHTQLALKTFESIIRPLAKTSGIIFSKGSPSCGYGPVNIYDPSKDQIIGKTMGLWAKFVCERYPLIPKIDSGNLNNRALREKFRIQVLIFYDFNLSVKKPRDLIKFHENYLVFFLDYEKTNVKKLESIFTKINTIDFKVLIREYSFNLFGVLFNN